MHPYFPYSQIISNVHTAVRRKISRYSYTGDWQMMQEVVQPVQAVKSPAISELYY